MPGPGGEAWTSDDVEYALAWKQLSDDICSGCGQPRSESFARENHDAYDVKALACHACAEQERERRVMQDKGMEMDGIHLVANKIPRGMA